VVTEAGRLEAAMDVFMDLFQSNRAAKAAFMTDRTQAFFRKLARAMADSRLLRLGFLDLGTNPAAAVMCFDYRKTVYLYNNGYDRRYHHLSVGGLSKVLMIKDCIERGRKMFDFLKGAESYKRHLGGREIPLLHCRIRLQASLGA
jgi:CelD/BcsL family acetyltransferase involved in cellulose biosynthesis